MHVNATMLFLLSATFLDKLIILRQLITHHTCLYTILYDFSFHVCEVACQEWNITPLFCGSVITISKHMHSLFLLCFVINSIIHRDI